MFSFKFRYPNVSFNHQYNVIFGAGNIQVMITENKLVSTGGKYQTSATDKFENFSQKSIDNWTYPK